MSTPINPAGGSRYRVSIRGLQTGDNYCACADYASNGLGTCKHIEFALHELQRKPGAKADELVTLLDEIFEDPAAKAVVFSQWLGTNEVLLRRAATRGWSHVYFCGGVPSEQRGGLVQRLHEDAGCSSRPTQAAPG